jgi:hypothetical protein
LIEEETVLTPLPPKKDPGPIYLKVPDEIAMSPYIYDSDIEESNDRESIGGDDLSAINSFNENQAEYQGSHQKELESLDNMMQQPIKDRRNMSHVPPIVTIHVDQDPNSIEPSKTPFTPPYSATTAATSIHPPAPISTNPFETVVVEPEQSPVRTPISTNPFEMALPDVDHTQKHPRSTNPFDYEPLPKTPEAPQEEDTEDNRSVQSTQSQKSENKLHKHHSWVSSKTHHLGLTLSRHSVGSFGSVNEENDGTKTVNEEDDGTKTNTKKHTKYNPFKRMLSRNGDKASQQSNNVSTEFSKKHALQRKDSASRRNAIHGPF